MTSPMVSTEWLAEHLDDPDIRVVEISSKKDKNEDPYWQGHIPGAIRWFWKDLCWHETDREFVTPEALAERLGACGVGSDHTLVLYGDPVQYGNYAFWALTMAGRENMKLLDGSRKKWLAESRPMTTEVPNLQPVDCPPGRANMSMRVGRDDVRAKLGDPRRFLLDLRSPEEYSGERVMENGKFDHGAERGGRIPGAVHLFFKELLNDDDTYKSPDELKRIFSAVGAEPEKYDDLVVYCRLSHRASLAWTALAYMLGHDNVKIYDGSWTEWGSIVGFPVER
jgi:thiosulfate/3-mercaptopyruvate sulfurtransferase